MTEPPRKQGRLRQIRVVAIRPRGSPREPPPSLPAREPGQEPSAFPAVPVPFTSMDLPQAILRGLEALGYGQATEVQARAIPLARSGRDLIVQSRTGTGKTTAFGVPMLERIDRSLSEVQALVLCPTRELTVQVTDELARLAVPSQIRVLSIYGGDSMARQLTGLRQGAQVVVGTPGRLLDHLRQETLRLGRVRTLIDYEAPASSMIFCNTRAETRTIFNYLAMRGLPVAMISSDLPQKKREQVMRRFRAKELRHLVATDVAARGIDIEDLSHVFLYSAPESSDQYIHRAGRTGRIGKTGKVISLVSGFDLMNF